MHIEDELLWFAADQYAVCGEWYVVRCLKLWRERYGIQVANEVQRRLEKQTKTKIRI
jgi:hypothetical protein